MSSAAAEHAGFCQVMKNQGLLVHSVQDVLVDKCDTNPEARAALEKLASSHLNYELIDGELSEEGRVQLGDEYKSMVLSKVSVSDLVDMIMMRPTMMLRGSNSNTPLECDSVSQRPLANMVFCRDHLITTACGVVVCSMATNTRRAETNVIRFCLDKLKVPILGTISQPGTLEGGDFVPAGKSLCFISIGIRTNSQGVQQLLDNGWLNTKRVAVVKDYFDRQQQRMHLDIIFNLLARRVAFLHHGTTTNSPTQRLVDEYRRNASGEYVLVQHDVPFQDYLVAEGYDILVFPEQIRANYGANYLHLGSKQFINADSDTIKYIEKSPLFSGKMIHMPYKNITSMHGSFHCSAQVLSRSPCNPQIPVVNNRDAIIIACCNGQVHIILQYLEKGFPINDIFYLGYNLLHIAIIFNQTSLVCALTKVRANVNFHTEHLLSPLDLAYILACSDDTSVIEHLINCGAISYRHFSSRPSTLLHFRKKISAIEYIRNKAPSTASTYINNISSITYVLRNVNDIFANSLLPFAWIGSRRPYLYCHSQSARHVLLAPPLNFDSPSYVAVHPGTSSTLPDSRHARSCIQRAFSLIFRALSDHGVEVYFHTVDDAESSPYALHVGSYLSTHFSHPSGQSSVLHSDNPFCHSLASFMQGNCSQIVFSHDQSTPRSLPPSITFDRIQHVAYFHTSLDHHSFLSFLGYTRTPLSSPQCDIRQSLFLGTHVALICHPWLSSSPPDSLHSLSTSLSKKTVIEFSPEQAALGAIGSCSEFLDAEDCPILLTSTSSLWTPAQLSSLSLSNTQLVPVDLESLAQITRAPLHTLLAPLY